MGTQDCIMGKNREKVFFEFGFYLFFAVVVVLVYHNYLSGERFFLSKKDAMDLYEQYYPSLLTIARQITNGEILTQMDFTRGLGFEVNNIFPIIQNLPAYFGEENVAYMLGVCQALKVYFSGVVFYNYLKTMNISKYVSMIAGMGYAFCGHMMVRQFWAFFSNEVLLVALWLLCFEFYFLKKKRYWMPLVTVIFFINCQTYYIVLYIIIFTAYAIFRYASEGELFRRKKECIILTLLLIVSGVVTVGIANLGEQYYLIINNMDPDTAAASVPDTGAGISFLSDKQTFISAFFRTIGLRLFSDLNLAEPTFYCGIFLIFMTFLYIFYFQGRKRIWYTLALGAAAIYFIICPVRVLANAMQYSNFKLSSFWIIILFLFLSAHTLDRFLEEPKAISVVAAAVFALLSVGISIFYYLRHVEQMNATMMACSILFMMGYVMILITYYRNREQKRFLKILLFIAFTAEISVFSYSAVNDVDTLSAEEFYYTGYNDGTMAALEAVEKDNEWQDYRIDKQYFSFRFCDSLAQGYYGTYFYVGGIGAPQSVKDFYNSMNLPTATSGSARYLYKYAYGPSAYTEINEVLGVKYILSRTPAISNYGYELIAQTDQVLVYENQYALPFVYVYNECIAESEFEKLSFTEKGKALMRAAVIEDDNGKAQEDIPLLDAADFQNSTKQYWRKDVAAYSLDQRFFWLEEYDSGCTLVLKVKFNETEPCYRARFNYNCIDGTSASYYVRIDGGEQEYTYEINAENVSAFAFINYDGEPLEVVVEECYAIPSDIYYESYRDSYEQLKKNAMQIEEFSGRCIRGTVELENSGILYFAAPYTNWHIYIDGVEAETFPTNIGFTGAMIGSGTHKIEMKYDNGKWISVDNAILIVVIMLFLIWAIRGSITEKRRAGRTRGSRM